MPESEVVEMNRRLTGTTQSLNAPIGKVGETKWQDLLEDESENQENLLGARQEAQLRRSLLHTAVAELSERERRIIAACRLTDTSRTLEDLAGDYSVSRERIRQIETAAVLKLQRKVKIAAEQRRITL